jgi:CheY-like chemotaxis protein
MLFKTIFTRWQVAFEEVDNGLKALEMIRSNHYDMVFMDARMPGLDGLEAAQHIRKNFAISAEALPIIGTSATHNKEDMQMYLSAGMNAFLPKPFTEKMLLDAILSVLPVKKRSVKKQLLPESMISYIDENIAVDTVTSPELLQGFETEADTSVNLSNIYHLANNDITFVKQLITSFIESTDKGIQSLQDAVHSKDIGAIYEIAHRISSPCRHIGADNLYSHLKMMEEQAKNNKNIGILAKLTTESKKDFLEIKEGLKKHLERI